SLRAVLVSGPSHGMLTLNPDGSFTYTADANYHGTDSFLYQASDGSALSAPATVTLQVLPVNDAPVAADDAFRVAEDQVLSVGPTGVLANDTDADGDTLSVVLVSGPSNGVLTLNPDGSFTYTPVPDFNGTDTFTYLVNDGSLSSTTATVTITVAP